VYRDESLARPSNTACQNASTLLLVTLLVIGTSFDTGMKSFTVLVERSSSAILSILSTDELSLSAAVALALVGIGACFGFGSGFCFGSRFSFGSALGFRNGCFGSGFGFERVLGFRSGSRFGFGSVLGFRSGSSVFLDFSSVCFGFERVGSGLRVGVTVTVAVTAVTSVGRFDRQDVCTVYAVSSSLMSYIK